MRDGFKLGFGSIAVLLCLRPTIQALFPSRGGGAVDGGHYLRGGDGSSPLGADLLWIHPDSQPFVSFVYFAPRHAIEKEFCRLGALALALSFRFLLPSSRIERYTKRFQNEHSVTSHATHLIIVAGHSVLISGNVQNAAFDDSVWYLYDYQKNKGLPRAIVSHIQAGIRLALDDPNSLLVFSGGETRARTGPETEGGSYFRVADALDLWDGRDVFLSRDADASDSVVANLTVRARTVSEEYATDSFENMMFSICRFHEVTGHYPNKISLVSFTFKRRRFETLHASALRWPLDRFHYVGIDPPPSTGFDLAESTEGENNNSLLPFRSDPYGCHSEILQHKRKERNPFSRTAPYELTCPEMKELLHWCGPESISNEKLPWG
jgi:hypothetical protein